MMEWVSFKSSRNKSIYNARCNIWERQNLHLTCSNTSLKESSRTDETEKLFEEQPDSIAKTPQKRAVTGLSLSNEVRSISTVARVGPQLYTSMLPLAISSAMLAVFKSLASHHCPCAPLCRTASLKNSLHEIGLNLKQNFQSRKRWLEMQNSGGQR